MTPARDAMRARAAATDCSVAVAKRARANGSCVKACTVRKALSVSSASAPRSATRSCATRDSLRSRRENTTSGTTTNGTTAATRAESSGEVITSMPNAPSSSRAERSHCDSAEPVSACSTEVSACRRDSTSPTRAVSNQAGDRVSTRSNTARRRSAPIRSPSQVTRAKRLAVAKASRAMTQAMTSAVAFSLAVLPLAKPPSIRWRKPWPSTRTSPAEASSASVAPATCQR